MLAKTLIPWQKQEITSFKHILEKFYYKDFSLDLIFKEIDHQSNGANRKKIKISFKNSVLFYRITNESLRISEDNLGLIISAQSTIEPAFLYTVANSRLVTWLLKQKEFQSTDLTPPLTHFICQDTESFIEIVTSDNPTIEWTIHAME